MLFFYIKICFFLNKKNKGNAENRYFCSSIVRSFYAIFQDNWRRRVYIEHYFTFELLAELPVKLYVCEDTFS